MQTYGEVRNTTSWNIVYGMPIVEHGCKNASFNKVVGHGIQVYVMSAAENIVKMQCG